MTLLETIQSTIKDSKKFQPIPLEEQNFMYTYSYDPYYQTLIKREVSTGRPAGSLSIPMQDLYEVLKVIEKHVGRVDMKVN